MQLLAANALLAWVTISAALIQQPLHDGLVNDCFAVSIPLKSP